MAVDGSVVMPGASLRCDRKCAEDACKIRRRLAQNPLPIPRALHFSLDKLFWLCHIV
jgi:hypothetical protein